ncbi:MAG: VPLPA-CTERM sorting domain-containing protein [Pseudomonadota bacterium]
MRKAIQTAAILACATFGTTAASAAPVYILYPDTGIEGGSFLGCDFDYTGVTGDERPASVPSTGRRTCSTTEATTTAYVEVNPGEIKVSGSGSGTFSDGGSIGAVSAGLFQDTITIDSGPSEGFLQVDYAIDGTGTGTTDVSGASQLYRLAATISGSSFDFGSPGPGGASIDGRLFFTQNLMFNEVLTAMLPYTGGQLDLFLLLEVGHSCRVNTGPGSCSFVYDFLNTAKVENITVLDTEGEAVSCALISAASGHDYGQDVAPIPLPASAAMFLVALGGLGLVTRRR